MNIELRQKLDKIVSTENEKNWYVPELFIKNTLPQLPKELHVVNNPPEESNNYNCFLYVLGLQENREVLEDTSGFIYSPLIEHLIKVGELKEVSQSKPGLIVLYKNENSDINEFTHSGLVNNDGKVISKWSWGPIIIHELFDVPLSYGDLVKYYEPISKEKAIDLYEKYKSFNH